MSLARIQKFSLGLIRRGYKVLVSPKSHLNGWKKQQQQNPPKQTSRDLICKSLGRILALYCLPIKKKQEIVLTAPPLQLPMIYQEQGPFQALCFTPANRLSKHIPECSVQEGTAPTSLPPNATCLCRLLHPSTSWLLPVLNSPSNLSSSPSGWKDQRN